MSEPVLGIVGGSGLYELAGLTDTRWVDVDTPWGAPSDEVFTGTLATAAGPLRLAFLPRHGRGHRLSPSDVPYRANIAALKQLGVTDVLSLSAVGGLRADLPPAVKAGLEQRRQAVIAGRLKPFSGRLVDNTGRERLARGALDDEAIAQMDWLVEGVVGSLPGAR